MRKLATKLEVSLGLSQGYQQQLTRKYNGVVSDPFAFTPHEKRGQVSLAEVITENFKLGEFASERPKHISRHSKTEDKLRRMAGGKKIVAVGFGRGYDSEWVEEAVLACLEVWWLDVSDVACNLANASMTRQYVKIRARGLPVLPPVVKQAEIQSILADPGSIGLDLSTVEIWYFCRTLTCLSERSAKTVLQQLGRISLSREADPEGSNRIELVSAMRDYNPNRVGRRSKLYTIAKILANVRRGAERPVEVVRETACKYFDQVYTGMTIRAK